MAKEISLKRLVHYWPLYLFVLPSVLMVAVFAYYPAVSAMFHSFYRWNGDYIEYYIGATNYRTILGRPALWVALMVLSFVMVFNSQKKGPWAQVPKILCGVGLPLLNVIFLLRLAPPSGLQLSDAFFPLLIWGALLLLVLWRLDSDSDYRIVFTVLIVAFGMASVFRSVGFNALFAWSLSVGLLSTALWVLPSVLGRVRFVDGLRVTVAIAGIGMMLWMLGAYAGGEPILWKGFSVIAVLVAANIVKMIPSIATAVAVHRLKSERANYWYRVLFVVPMIIPGMVYLLLWKFFFESSGLFNLILKKTGIMDLLYLIDWKLGNGLFLSKDQLAANLSIQDVLQLAADAGPAWLGSEQLVLPAFIIWGFPWVGVVGVLIYLAGLQSIDDSVYEAADLDGVGAFGKFLHIELPLILTQVRINLVLMIIGTLQMYGLILILYGDGGGPNGKMMVPGLYMFREAFVEGHAGLACAVGIVIFFLILILTEINNRFVKVDK